MTQTIGSYSVIEYPKAVTITDDESAKISLLPDNDPSKAFDMTYAVADTMIEDLVTARPVTDLEPGNIRDGVTIAGIAGTYGPGADPFLLPENIKSGITIYGVTSNMPLGDDVNGADGDLQITIPEGRYDGSKVTIASDANLIAGNIKTGVTIFGIASTMPAGPASTFGADGSLTVGINAGYYTGTEETSASDANLIGANIKPGITIFGVASTMTEGADIVDAQAVTPIAIPAGYYDGTETVHA